MSEQIVLAIPTLAIVSIQLEVPFYMQGAPKCYQHICCISQRPKNVPFALL